MEKKKTLPSLDLKRNYQRIKEEIDEAVHRVLDSQYFILGPEVEAFEKEVSAYLGVKRGVGCASGSDSLLLALMALDLKPGDEVITSPYTFFATVSCITRLGLTPVFVDIDPVSYCLDVNRVMEKVTARTKVFLPVHIFGQMVPMDGLMDQLSARDIAVVEDGAQAFGSWRRVGDQIIRASAWGTIGCFSFFPTKNLGCYGDGGMVVTNCEALGEKLARLRVHGAGTTYYHDEVGLNSRLDALQAAILRVRMKYLEVWNEERRAAADRYRLLASQYNLLDRVGLPETVPGNGHTYHQYVIRARRRDELMAYLAEEGITTRVYYPLSLHLQKCFAFLGGKAGDYPESERLTQEALALPMFPELTGDEQQWVMETIAKFYREKD